MKDSQAPLFSQNSLLTTPLINPVINWWLPRIKTIFQDNLNSVFLHGSAILDDFNPGWSDIDMCVILKQPIGKSEGLLIGKIHDEMEKIFIIDRKDRWKSGQVIECYYIPEYLCNNPKGKTPVYIAGENVRSFEITNPVKPFERYILSGYPLCIFGNKIQFEPPDIQELREQTSSDCKIIFESPAGCKSAIYITGIFHWIARTLVFWRDKKFLSKTAALEYEIKNDSPYRPAFELALQLRKEGAAQCRYYYDDLRGFYERYSKGAYAEILKLAK